jgi:ankyrin repeat protein
MNQFEAAKKGALQQLREALTTNNVNAFQFGHEGSTTLHYTTKGHLECVKLCIEMGANVNVCHADGWTPLHHAAQNGTADIVRVLLDAGARVNAMDMEEHTPLFWSIEGNHRDISKVLIDRGATVKIGKYYPAIPSPGWLAMFIASRLQCRHVAIVLIGIHKYYRTKLTSNNDINVIKLISKHIWSTRMNDDWVSAATIPTATQSRHCHTM